MSDDSNLNVEILMTKYLRGKEYFVPYSEEYAKNQINSFYILRGLKMISKKSLKREIKRIKRRTLSKIQIDALLGILNKMSSNSSCAD